MQPACTRSVFSTLFLIAVAVLTSQPTQAQTFSVLHNFTGADDGSQPYAGVTMDGAGNLYGTTFYGGPGLDGAAYELKRVGSEYVVDPLFDFYTGSGVGGTNPVARVVFGPEGLLYGTAQYGGPDGGGTVFKLQPPVEAPRTAIYFDTETVLYAFSTGPDGYNPNRGDLLFDQGNIYDTTISGGNPCGCGVVYELSPPGNWSTETVLYSFSGSDGSMPFSGVISDNAGNLYGTTYSGGLYDFGTVYELSPSGSGWTERVIHSFTGGSDGGHPFAGLTFDQAGNLYGATSDYGTSGGGTVFELSTTFTVLHSFSGPAGNSCGPAASLFIDSAGNLYDTTSCDGSRGYGSVFKLTPTPTPPWTLTDYHDFTGGSDGSNPFSNVVLDTSGNLYGTASRGGSQTVGVVWEITP
jgi:uncharacterized repeat protein (TIGR03803 family)